MQPSRRAPVLARVDRECRRRSERSVRLTDFRSPPCWCTGPVADADPVPVMSMVPPQCDTVGRPVDRFLKIVVFMLYVLNDTPLTSDTHDCPSRTSPRTDGLDHHLSRLEQLGHPRPSWLSGVTGGVAQSHHGVRVVVLDVAATQRQIAGVVVNLPLATSSPQPMAS